MIGRGTAREALGKSFGFSPARMGSGGTRPGAGRPPTSVDFVARLWIGWKCEELLLAAYERRFRVALERLHGRSGDDEFEAITFYQALVGEVRQKRDRGHPIDFELHSKEIEEQINLPRRGKKATSEVVPQLYRAFAKAAGRPADAPRPSDATLERWLSREIGVDAEIAEGRWLRIRVRRPYGVKDGIREEVAAIASSRYGASITPRFVRTCWDDYRSHLNRARRELDGPK